MTDTEFINKATDRLMKNGYRAFAPRYYAEDGDKPELCFYRKEVSLINIIIMIETDSQENFKERFDRLTEILSGLFVENFKIMSLGIAVGKAVTKQTVCFEEFMPDMDIMKANWAVNTETGQIFFQKGAPKKVGGVERLLKEVLENGGKAAEEKVTAYHSGNNLNIKKKVVITYILFATNIIMYIILCLNSGPDITPTTDSLLRFGALYGDYVRQGQLWRLISCVFIHINLFHIMSNMLSLYIFGTRCEKYYGYIRFGLLYIISGLGSSLLSFAFNRGAVSAGASGAIMGLISSGLVYTLTNRTDMEGLDFSVFVIFSFINIGFGFAAEGFDNFGHIGGFLTGLVLGGIFYFSDKKRYNKNEKAL